MCFANFKYNNSYVRNLFFFTTVVLLCVVVFQLFNNYLNDVILLMLSILNYGFIKE